MTNHHKSTNKRNAESSSEEPPKKKALVSSDNEAIESEEEHGATQHANINTTLYDDDNDASIHNLNLMIEDVVMASNDKIHRDENITTAVEGATAVDTTETAMTEEVETNAETTTATDTSNNRRCTETTAAATTNPYDAIKWRTVRNDGSNDSMIKLTGLKSLFSRQLPKMPRAYIARLVFDRRHESVAILSEKEELKDTDDEIIGGICFRIFEEMRFAEIAFCAVNSAHQVKGYGTKLMCLVKQIMAQRGIEYLQTYADNFAVGYFRKQGFCKALSGEKGSTNIMTKGRYHGLIKDYDGGTLMECYIHPSIDYTRIPEMLDAQRDFILSQVKKYANSHTVYDPLPKGYTPNLEGISRTNIPAARAMVIPGVVEAGWTFQDLVMVTSGQGRDGERQKGALKNELLSILRKIDEQQFVWPFRLPVDTDEVKDYLDVIKEPIDLSTITARVKQDNHYKSKQMMYADLMLMVNNCKLYNEPKSTYTQCAYSLERFMAPLFQD